MEEKNRTHHNVWANAEVSKRDPDGTKGTGGRAEKREKNKREYDGVSKSDSDRKTLKSKSNTRGTEEKVTYSKGG